MGYKTTILYVTLTAILLTGCSRSRLEISGQDKLHVVNADTPLTGRDSKAVELRRYYYSSFLSATPSGDILWELPYGKRVYATKYVKAVDGYLKRQGLLSSWPEYGAEDEHGNRARLAPYRINLVAIDPIVVVLLTPRDYLERLRAGESSTQVLGWDSDQSVGSKYLLNPIWYGTSVPVSPDILYFDANSESPPKKVMQKEQGVFEARFDETTLGLTKEGEVFRVSLHTPTPTE